MLSDWPGSCQQGGSNSHSPDYDYRCSDRIASYYESWQASLLYNYCILKRSDLFFKVGSVEDFVSSRYVLLLNKCACKRIFLYDILLNIDIWTKENRCSLPQTDHK
jgi:hypothetical protein